MKTMKATTLLVTLMTAAGCTQGLTGITGTAEGVGTLSAFNVNQYPLNKLVCSPMGGSDPVINAEHGIMGSLFYKGALDPRYYSALDYVNKLQRSPQRLFFTDMNVPTRMFSEGFATKTSSYVKDDTGSKLIEFFGMKMETEIRLASDQSAGDYEFAMLADDGAIMEIKQNGTWSTYISNDGDHPTKMGCSNKIVHLEQGQKLPIQYYYYQGPRFHISNVLMWRKASADTVGKDPLCGQLGNGLYFDPNKNSTPQKAYQDLLARGWQPVEARNFYVPSEDTYNPCVEGTDPQITQFQLSENLANDAFVSWTTDIEATSQVLITEISTGIETLTETDNMLRTSHLVHISGLKANTAYKAQAISISGDLGKSISAPIEFTTLK